MFYSVTHAAAAIADLSTTATHQAVLLSAKLDTKIPIAGYLHAMTLALDGQHNEAEKLVDSLIDSGKRAPTQPLALWAIGRSDEARQIVLALDATPGAPTRFARGIVLAGGGNLVYPPSWTPNFTTLLDSAGVDLELRTLPGMPVDDSDGRQQ